MSDDLRECARGNHCSSRTPAGPARGPRPFCDRDRDIIGQALADFPRLYLELEVLLREPTRATGPKVSTVRPHPPIPLNLPADALMRELAETLAGWEERVRAVARLSGPDTAASRHRRPALALAAASRTLAAHLDALLALQPEPMPRHTALHVAADWAAAGVLGIVRPTAGYATTIRDLDGADAGLELLALHHRARRLLGWTTNRRPLPTPCPHCGLRTASRAEGELSASCSSCHTTYIPEGT